MSERLRLQKIYQDLQSFKNLKDDIPLWERLKALRNYYAFTACQSLLLDRPKEAYEYAEWFDYAEKLYLKALIREVKRLNAGGGK
jgi:hypothetical protein